LSRVAKLVQLHGYSAVQVYITALWAYYRDIEEKWEERGRKMGRERREKGGEKRGERKKV